MKPVKPNKMEFMSYCLLMPVVAIAFCFLLLGSNWFLQLSSWLGFVYICTVGLISWYLDVWSLHWIHAMYPAYKDTIKRMLLVALKKVVTMFLLSMLVVSGIEFLSAGTFSAGWTDLWKCWAIGYGITFISTIYWEGEYFMAQWKESLSEHEKYEQLTLQTAFDNLKSQVNPHFLFNCFNTLSSLIAVDKKQAEVFLNELSKVYRYLLRTNETGLTTLKGEVAFLYSYIKLLNTRHGQALQFKLEIDPAFDNFMVPSLSLQLLIENAVKHNTLSNANPLLIEIYTTAGGSLIVRNRIQPLTQQVVSGKIGLKNIQTKYELLKISGFRITNDRKHFEVSLPLIADSALAKSKIDTLLPTN